MKKILYIILSTLFLMPSCIDGGLDEIEDFSEAKIIEFKFEHRWTYFQEPGEENANEIEQLAVVSMSTNTSVSEDNTINCEIIVPAAGSPGYFTAEERSKVSLSSLIGKATISTAATIIPIGEAPALGNPGDFSKQCKYIVTAADGVTKREYTVICTLVK
jgi:hypothetical protein